MRVCPCCGFIDPSEWRHSKYSYWIDWTEFERFKELCPELAEQFEHSSKIVEDKNYYYRRMKHGRSVERKAKVDYGEQWTIPMEKRKQVPHDFRKHWFFVHPNQIKLSVPAKVSVVREKEATK
jgi:hypothetical protein